MGQEEKLREIDSKVNATLTPNFSYAKLKTGFEIRELSIR